MSVAVRVRQSRARRAPDLGYPEDHTILWVPTLNPEAAFFQNFSTVKAQHLQTKGDQVPIPSSVFQGVIASQVLGAIHFHDQLRPWCEEIHNVLTDGFLQIELDAKKLFVPQA
jgi:hypothetical protein